MNELEILADWLDSQSFMKWWEHDDWVKGKLKEGPILTKFCIASTKGQALAYDNTLRKVKRMIEEKRRREND